MNCILTDASTCAAAYGRTLSNSDARKAAALATYTGSLGRVTEEEKREILAELRDQASAGGAAMSKLTASAIIEAAGIKPKQKSYEQVIDEIRKHTGRIF